MTQDQRKTMRRSIWRISRAMTCGWKPQLHSRALTSDLSLRSGAKPDLRSLRMLRLELVNVRKGIHYLMEAARLIEGENVHFDVVGSLGILPGAVAPATKNMTFHGSVSRDHAAKWYQQGDVFVLPTLSDGFAPTQPEVLAHGVPVIATPNCGRVVEDGKTGFIVPARDAAAHTNAILKFATDPDLRHRMSSTSLEAVHSYTLAARGRWLVEIIQTRQCLFNTAESIRDAARGTMRLVCLCDMSVYPRKRNEPQMNADFKRFDQNLGLTRCERPTMNITL